MALARQQIRKQVAAILGSLSSTNGRVSTNRVRPFAAAELPATNLLVISDDVQDDLGSTRIHKLALEVQVLARISDPDLAADTLDTICAEIETAIAMDALLQSLAVDVSLRGTTFEHSGDIDQLAAVASITYDLIYHTTRTDPEVLGG